MSITEERPAVLAGDRERTILALAVARTWRDEEYKARLMADPRSTLAAEGLQFPGHPEVRAVTGPASAVHVTSDVVEVVVPEAPDWIGPVASGRDELVCAPEEQAGTRGEQPVKIINTLVVTSIISTETNIGAAIFIS